MTDIIDKITDFEGAEDITGSKVKIAKDRILKRDPDLSKRYLEFLSKSDGKEFTAELSIKWNKDNYFYTLKEDDTVPKWIFAVDDLDVIDGNDVN